MKLFKTILSIAIVCAIGFSVIPAKAATTLRAEGSDNIAFAVPSGGYSYCEYVQSYTEQYTANGNYNIWNYRTRYYAYYTIYATEKPKMQIGNIVHETSTGYITKTFTSYTNVATMADAKYESFGMQKNTESLQYNVATGYIGRFPLIISCSGALVPTVGRSITIGFETKSADAEVEDTSKIEIWGDYLASLDEKNKRSQETIVFDGIDVDIVESDIEQYKKYYDINGNENSDVEAENYAKEYNALYINAVKNGYTVSEQEIKDFIALISETEQYQIIENCFDDSNSYYEYLYDICQKDCIIQKYVKDLEKQYYSDENNQIDSFDEYFDDIKENLVEQQNFVSL